MHRNILPSQEVCGACPGTHAVAVKVGVFGRYGGQVILEVDGLHEWWRHLLTPSLAHCYHCVALIAAHSIIIIW
ncbi:hypothetical protein E2C01_037332 [Portunus trituberculatus]|uniref:Uncharacterized protein n=1 Tax=Portunus trituberculatus TaxID=210409 RepID=A0A5B7F927_PORTR|nr:hypothetical protein [Portunus trituberculatus]